MKNKQGYLIVIVAPSGAGKSTLIKKLLEDRSQLKWSISHTTRPKREGEVEGQDYFFTKEDEFEAMISGQQFVEWAKVHNNYYGTSKKTLAQTIQAGQSLLLDLDTQGTDQLLASFPSQTRAIFIAPPSIETLRKRLIARGTEKEEVINVRIANAREQMKRKNDYHFQIINDDLKSCYQELLAIIDQILSEQS